MNNFQEEIYAKLDKLDDYLSVKNQSERLMYGVVIGILLAALVYFLLFDLSDEYKLNASDSYNEIVAKVNHEQEYIDSMENGGFLSLEQRTRAAQSEISQSQDNLKVLEGLRNEIFIYSKDWFLTFDDASKAAIATGLTINGTDVKMSDTPSLGGMKYSSFVLFGYGTYSSILKYMDWLEIYGKFISIDSMIIESRDNRLNFSVSIRNFRGEA